VSGHRACGCFFHPCPSVIPGLTFVSLLVVVTAFILHGHPLHLSGNEKCQVYGV
jgi:hypothetical protein